MIRIVCIFLLLLSQKLSAQNFLTGRTTGQLPFLEYGLGDDRLGGAKMTYLDTNVLIKVVDSVNTDYKIQLSKNHFAYLAKQSFKQDTLKLQPYYLTSSWRIWGDENYDYVSIGLTEKLPYNTIQQVNPAKIVVDIFGATSNTNWITQLKTVKEIKNVWYEQIEDDVFRVYIELKHQQHWGYFISYNKNALQIRVKRQPSRLKPKRLLVAIDAGHGGSNSGATGVTSNIHEKEYTLKIAQQVEKYLKRKKVKVLMTREDDKDISMIDRTLILRQADPDILISVHLNSSGNENIKGVSTYYRYIGFRPLSEKILSRMLELQLNNFGNVGGFNFSLSGPTEYPNCLVEVAFLSNKEDEQRIVDPSFHKAVAKKIYKGIKDWLKSVK
ncbi:MAG TPA: N-acetylmuramoyl-L-alanine amidase [Flavisolibacter sp.]|jgi:N-acetylmuramoyl-L-alanine amidase|nr:N-acetylmuramoyl-L-alanine amidase [Flavisolibacter sp.]